MLDLRNRYPQECAPYVSPDRTISTRTVSVPYDAIGDATEKRIGGTGLTMTANDNKIGAPLFRAS